MVFSRALMTVEEAVLVTGISRSLLYKAIQSGELPSRVLGQRRRRILVGDLEKCSSARRSTSPGAHNQTRGRCAAPASKGRRPP